MGQKQTVKTQQPKSSSTTSNKWDKAKTIIDATKTILEIVSAVLETRKNNKK